MPTPAAMTKIMPIVVLAIGITALSTVYLRYDEGRYKPVFGAHEQVPVTDMVATLDGAHIAYRIHPDSGQILVPDAELGKVRMLLAAKGVVAKLPAGLELVDQNDPLGTSQFVQDVRFRRGLEGELAQSIATLDPVQAARVHLAIGKSTSFVVSDADKSSASVVLTLKAGRTLTNEQIAAIVNLVAHSVANLDPANVTVVDQAGDYLSSRVDSSDSYDATHDASQRYRDEALRNVRDLLAPTVGAGNFKASVTAEVNNDKVEETREQYGETPKLTNEATREERSDNRPALGVPGSLSNRPVPVPPASGAASAAAADSGSVRAASTRQYQYDREIVQIKRSRGRLQKLSVAVVMNNAASPAAGKPWTPEQLKGIDTLLRNGLGIDSARGDQLAVTALDFPAPAAAADAPWWQDRDTLFDLGRYAAYAFGCLFAFLLIVRPLLRIAQQWAKHRYGVPAAEAATATATALTGGSQAGHADDGDAAKAALEAATQGSMVPLLAAYELPPAGSSVDVMVEHLRSLSEKEPERVAEVVKQWVRKNGQAAG
ncbi:flagellar basal-body MS-ring/collar protein FliF [Trinickia mobilis]|uniref:flagellar basal-body MS-ring/collar protein FliF n=1 Tax=Trinickia mobilis TaxID=2816356 RepID=UPI001A90443E|nr:flagellar basal-body MS-ring/collar protein FliF [Trinickia mobilis]